VSGHRLEGCIVLRQQVQKVSGKQQLCVMIITHEDFKNEDGSFFELYAVKKHFKVTLEGDPDKFFDLPNEGTGVNVSDEEEGVLAPPEGATHEELRGNVEMDDDNEPLPENIPAANNEEETAVLDAEWGHDGICFRKQMNLGVTKPRLLFPYDGTADDVYLQLFEGLFPKEYVETILLEETNKKIEGNLHVGCFVVGGPSGKQGPTTSTRTKAIR
jgi:hypothetical protein